MFTRFLIRHFDARAFASLTAAVLCSGGAVLAQQPQARAGEPPKAAVPAAATVQPAPASVPTGVVPPPGYVIGPDDQLSVVFWREKDLTADVAVRPDGKISLPLLNDIEATGLTPEQLRGRIADAAGKFVEDPTVTVVVKQINSRKVFITGQVPKPGPYPLGGPTNVLQLIATAGGINEYADSEHIVIVRTENGQPKSINFNYKDVVKRKRLQQNIELKPGDTVIVP